ncbi:ABC transporter ATP-binding protein [Bdellovibrio bacteriovorus]|uniref:ABC transporter, ATP-binding protein n=1 Tax=Bdellovibrio bacteriovorus (strain ATCC 15356 / DSM 50701 / NCIMB 9529 / HD100) TaxID=264462 RepID=Q6MMA8_BDEBA|nr:ABC transporter ATP-binding protein [Bdellovibrio bacteriovorus]CAE79597.1 ABC transporter, ATP-binding protein [Bdellovibrio bacteriovorus HD100]
MRSPLISIANLKKSYGAKVALHNVGFSVEPSQIVALLGPNGAGKSTTLKILLGLRSADEGVIQKPDKSLIGYAGQEISFPAHLKTIEVLRLVKAHYDRGPSIDQMAKHFYLYPFLHRQMGGLSGGEKRRVSLACALIGAPQVLVLDEPTTGLDVESRIHLWQEIRNFAQDGGAVLLSTHDLNEVSQVAHRVVIIDHGTVLFDGPTADITRSLKFKTLKFRAPEAPVSGLIDDCFSEGHSHRVLTQHTEALLKELINNEYFLEDLEVSSATLEEAFIHLRKKHHEKAP